MIETLTYWNDCYRFGAMQSGASNRVDLFESRLRQALSAPNILAASERLASLMQHEGPKPEALSTMVVEAQKAGPRFLEWARENIRLAGSLARMSKDRDALFAALDEIIPQIEQVVPGDVWLGRRQEDYELSITLLSPLAHGSDDKAGNATLFRRCQARARNGGLLRLPYYSGNALRGQMRDLLADDLCQALELPRGSMAPWFFHALYAGGALESASGKSGKATGSVPSKDALAKLGERVNSTTDLAGANQLRTMLPMLSVLGVAIGTQLYTGKVEVSDAFPRCRQTGHADARSADDMLAWEYLTRRDDDESHADGEHHGMIATHEILQAGVVMDAGVSLRPNVRAAEHSPERSCVEHGIKLLADRGVLGGNSRRGWGRVNIHCARDLDGSAYQAWLKAHAQEIRGFLSSIGAIDAGD